MNVSSKYIGLTSSTTVHPSLYGLYPAGITRRELAVSYSKLAEISRNSRGLYWWIGETLSKKMLIRCGVSTYTEILAFSTKGAFRIYD